MTLPKMNSLREVVGGSADEVAAKALFAVVIVIWNNFQVIGMSLFGFGVLLMVDALFGQALARKRGEHFSFTRFMVGPTFKMVMTACMLFCTNLVDGLLPNAEWFPDSPLFFGAAAFISVTQLIDVARKYGTLSGSKVANWIEGKLGGFIKIDESKDQ